MTGFGHAQQANKQLSKVLTEAGIPNLQGHVDVDPTDRKGWGSFGEVFVGQYNGNSVCVKILKEIPFTEDRQWEKFLRRLKREVTVWRRARHPNVVALLGWTSQVTSENIRVSLISAWCDGGNIKDYLRRNPGANRLALIKDVCRGLTYLHSRDIVHGDIKPANIVVVGSSRQARLCDFGLSTLLGDASTYTEATSTFGSVRFLSPELLTGELEARNKASDIWAFGCASGEILRDERPYHWIANDRRIISAVTKGPPYTWPDPDDFAKCIASCFEIDPEERPSSFELLESVSPVAVLEDLLEEDASRDAPVVVGSWTELKIYKNSPFTFTTNKAFPQTLSIQDAGYKLEQFAVVVDGQQIGVTSPISPDPGVYCGVVLAARDTCEARGLSKGRFTIPAGSHTVQIVNIIGVSNDPRAASNTPAFYQLERQYTPSILPPPRYPASTIQDWKAVTVYKDPPYEFKFHYNNPIKLSIIDAGYRTAMFAVSIDGAQVGLTDDYSPSTSDWGGTSPEDYQRCVNNGNSQGEFVVPAGSHTVTVTMQPGVLISPFNARTTILYRTENYCPFW